MGALVLFPREPDAVTLTDLLSESIIEIHNNAHDPDKVRLLVGEAMNEIDNWGAKQ